MASAAGRALFVGSGLVMWSVSVTGCSGSSAGPGTSASASGTSVATTSQSTVAPASPTSSTPVPPSSLPGDVTLRGTVGGEGLTCVSFTSTDGRRFALSGPGLPAKLVSVARSLGQRSDLDSPPGGPQVATVTLIGHPVKGAMSTCNATVFSVTSASIQSISNTQP